MNSPFFWWFVGSVCVAIVFVLASASLEAFGNVIDKRGDE